MTKIDSLFMILAKNIQDVIRGNVGQLEHLQEIRIRIQKPIFLKYGGIEHRIPHLVTESELKETMNYISEYSLYAYEDELRQGYITIKGGHRIGISGKVVLEKGRVKTIQYISSITIRVSHEIKGCADKLFPYILEHQCLCNTMIISPPGCGKTTLLRDLTRQVSNGNTYIRGHQVSVVDERSELAGCYRGKPEEDVGERTDILDACPKVNGMMMMVRSMAPEVLVVDEIGSKEEVEALLYAIHCGVTTFITIHGGALEDVKRKPYVKELWEEKILKRYILLSQKEKIGDLEGIFDENGRCLCG